MNEKLEHHLKCIYEILQEKQIPFLFLTKEDGNAVVVKNLTEKGEATLILEYMGANIDLAISIIEVIRDQE